MQPDAWTDNNGEHIRRIGPWILRVWFYDPAEDGPPLPPTAVASWWWSVCLSGTEECDAGLNGAPATVLWIGGDRCADADEGRQRAMDGLQGWLAMQAGHVETLVRNWCHACGASLALGSVAAEGRCWCLACFGKSSTAPTTEPPAPRKLLRARSRDRRGHATNPLVHLVFPGETKAICGAYLGAKPVTAENAQDAEGRTSCRNCALQAVAP